MIVYYCIYLRSEIMKVILKLRWLLAVVGLVFLSGSGFAAEAADLEYITIYKAERNRSCMYTQFTRLKNGDLLCAFRDSQIDVKGEHKPRFKKGSPWSVPGSRIMCVRSTDNGRTWSKTPTFIYQDKDNFAYTSQGGLGHQAADGTIIVPFYVCNYLAETGDPLTQFWCIIARSKDNGQTWECERQSSAPFFAAAYYGGIIHLDNGSLWMPSGSSGYKIDLTQAKAGKKTRGCYRLMESTDDGKTWSHYSYLGYDPTQPEETAHFPNSHQLQEPAVAQLPSGKILMITRPFMHKGVSLNRGRTWTIGPSALTRNGTSGLCPTIWYTKAGPPTGTIVLVYHDRWGEHAKRGGHYISFSHDEGETWGYPIFIDGGAYPALYELEKNSGKFLCGYYRSSALLKGVFFSVPFPTGLRAISGLEDSEQLGVTVKWDEYKGQDYEKYEYRLYRSTQSEFELTPSTLVCSGKDIYSYSDKAAEKDRAYYYRVAVYRDGEILGRSWLASAKSDVRPQPSPEDAALIKDNIAPNPSFEMFGGKENDGNPDSISDYTLGQRPGSDLRAYAVSGGKFGKYCVKLDNSRGTAEGYIYFTFSNKDFAKTYRHTAFVRSDQPGQTFCGTALTRDWQKIVITERYQENSKLPWVYINVPAKMVIYVDGVEFRELK